MKRIVTSGIILGRLNFGEADRILTALTAEQGKLRLMAKGVRKSTSKMAGGIELFSITSLTFIPGKGEISTLVSSRLVRHYGNIVKDLERTALAYDVLKKINEATEAECEPEYFDTLNEVLAALDQGKLAREVIEAWFYMQLLKLAGHEPNLHSTAEGTHLQSGQQYMFDFETMAFMQSGGGPYNEQHIKMLRLLRSQPPSKLVRVQHIEQICEPLGALLKNMYQRHL